MAKKKSSRTGKTPKPPGAKRARGPRRERPATAQFQELARRLFHLNTMSRLLPAEARSLLDAARRSGDREERVKLARQALEVAPECADAYLFLGDEAESRIEALQLYEKALEVAENALGPNQFENHRGSFWEREETRPYMRARESVARSLWTMGRRDEAIGHLQELLKLNDLDNQGVRYTLVNWFLCEGRDAELAELVADYDEPSAAWAYTKALLAFRQAGNTPEARKLLDAARKRNKSVPDFILDRKLLPSTPPPMYQLGSEEEAIVYSAGALSAWKATPGATDWLKDREGGPKKRPVATTHQGPLPLVKKRLSRLPQIFDIWEVDCRQTGSRIEEDGDLINPWLVLVASTSSGLIMSQKLSVEPPTVDSVWDVVADAMQEPHAGPRHRPTEIQMPSDELWGEISDHLDDIGVTASMVDELETMDELFAELKESMNSEGPPGLLDIPGVTRDLVAAYCNAAADFYRKAPWRKLGLESAIRIATDRFQTGPWYAVIMGQSGITFGVALYEDLRILKKLWAGDLSDEENARETVALTMTFGEAVEVPDADLDAIEEYDFEVAGPKAYPVIFRKERGLTMRPPLAWELELMEACLRAIPTFVDQHRPDDLAPHPLTVPVATGLITLTMAWLDD